jgi:hypothetical protein
MKVSRLLAFLTGLMTLALCLLLRLRSEPDMLVVSLAVLGALVVMATVPRDALSRRARRLVVYGWAFYSIAILTSSTIEAASRSGTGLWLRLLVLGGVGVAMTIWSLWRMKLRRKHSFDNYYSE